MNTKELSSKHTSINSQSPTEGLRETNKLLENLKDSMNRLQNKKDNNDSPAKKKICLSSTSDQDTDMSDEGIFDNEDDTHLSVNNITSKTPLNLDPYAGYHLAGLTSNLNILQPHELYRDNIQGALALSKWLRGIEVASPDPKVRSRIALLKMDPEIHERLGENFHEIPWNTLRERLYSFVTPSTFDVALTKLYQMEYFGDEHPATFYSMLWGYLRTMHSTFPNDKTPSMTTVVRQCLLSGVTNGYKRYLNGLLSSESSLDTFLNKFTKLYLKAM